MKKGSLILKKILEENRNNHSVIRIIFRNYFLSHIEQHQYIFDNKNNKPLLRSYVIGSLFSALQEDIIVELKSKFFDISNESISRGTIQKHIGKIYSDIEKEDLNNNMIYDILKIIKYNKLNIINVSNDNNFIPID